MIVDLLLEVVGLLVEGVALLLPDADPPFLAQANAAAGTVASFLLVYDGLLPVADSLEFIRWVATVWLPGLLTYLTFRWIWSHVPFLGAS